MRGGVLIAVSDKYISSKLNIHINSLEICFVLIKLNNLKKLIISYVYFPPSTDSNLYIEYINVIEIIISNYPDTDLLLFGDFNLSALYKNS